ncbi:hypothetical protein [Mariluticola halotolerans]|uniref:hypothetical protein n=1 Tax=Mariluticola halotolerans TaxID=2909283 RepID=UPI0026E41773|nr:hypothetical protein [Mariluticola halotolerans]UJQ94457.1 hypothetical protein L1P08_00235 [Mariluticola halotolerans]
MFLARWAYAALMTGSLLLAIGILPLYVLGTLLNAATPPLVHLLFLLLSPLGAMIFALGLILWIITLFTR